MCIRFVCVVEGGGAIYGFWREAPFLVGDLELYCLLIWQPSIC